MHERQCCGYNRQGRECERNMYLADPHTAEVGVKIEQISYKRKSILNEVLRYEHEWGDDLVFFPNKTVFSQSGATII